MTHDFDYDLIVIGGGPAGSTVARYAAEAGISVLVLDARGAYAQMCQTLTICFKHQIMQYLELATP